MPRTRIFTVRDRRALTAVLTAGLRHTDIDTIIHSHPVPGDPGHDAGKAGRVGLLTATLLARSDHTGLAQALTMADTTKVISAGHGPALQRLRTKAGELLAPAAETPTPPGAPGPTPAADPDPDPTPHLDDTPAVELGDTPAAEIEPQERSALPVLTLDGLEMDHPIVAILVDAGVQVLPSTDQAPAGHLVLSVTPPAEEHHRPGRDIRAPDGPSA
ncbi:hypothetical protein [Micrococcus luteus]|uniref:hypothetical protein n=1 Tax=Micrococcus luteus TaxID=1270 RepID=UPI00044DB39B|nr:hypothetical protein [Micrococcus luteus]EZP59445.1 hypothetical protein BW40_00876 [Micrococcus luteus]MCV7543153.1 hypothetical protein [Micrococcus luteus]